MIVMKKSVLLKDEVDAKRLEKLFVEGDEENELRKFVDKK